jgi:hypothetical protein
MRRYRRFECSMAEYRRRKARCSSAETDLSAFSRRTRNAPGMQLLQYATSRHATANAARVR